MNERISERSNRKATDYLSPPGLRGPDAWNEKNGIAWYRQRLMLSEKAKQTNDNLLEWILEKKSQHEMQRQRRRCEAKCERQECVALKWRCTFSFEFCENWCGERRRCFTACYSPYIVNLLSARVKCILCSNQFNHKQIELSTAVQTFTSFDEKRNEHRLCSDHPPNSAMPSHKIV